MDNIMVDIETLDTVHSAVVLSIGAVAFDPCSKELGETFYAELTDPEVQQRVGRTISAATVRWWMQQDTAAKQLFADTPPNGTRRVSTAQGLTEFAAFIARNGGESMKLWGNGVDFDNLILGSLYESFSMAKPWSYGSNRCYRTLKRLFGENVKVDRIGVHHNGLDDAITQAIHTQEIMACIKQQ
jgi:exodeoxyribonuclease VIII